MIALEVQFQIALEVMLAMLLAGLIGMDRERKHRDAGLRTHMLIGMGACLFTGLSLNAFPGSDPARVASQILPGLGFLGAGTILKYGNTVQGLTTAASIWATAAIGMAVGVGAWFLAVSATVLIWFVLVIVKRIKQHVDPATHGPEAVSPPPAP